VRILCHVKYHLVQQKHDRKTKRLQQDKGQILLVWIVGFAMLSTPWMVRKEV
jgi:hypothetical protein